MPQTGKLRRGKGSANHGTCHALDSEANQLPSALQPWESHCRSLVVLNFFSSYLGKSDDIAPILLSFLLRMPVIVNPTAVSDSCFFLASWEAAGCMVYEESYPAPSAGLPLTSYNYLSNSLNK
jgi:hypothetical protein